MSCSDSPRDRPCIVRFDQRVTAPNMLTMDASLHGFSGPLSTACMYICSRENVTRFPLSGCSPISIVHCVGLPHPTLPDLTPTTPDMILRFRESCVLSICQCTCTLISPSPSPSKYFSVVGFTPTSGFLVKHIFFLPFGLTTCFFGALVFLQTLHWSWIMQHIGPMITQSRMIFSYSPSNEHRDIISRCWSCLATGSDAYQRAEASGAMEDRKYL